MSGEASRSGRGAADRLDARAWIDAAHEAFREGGVEAVRVDPLAKRLGVTRGSFYWHFENRAALLGAVLGRWAHETREIVEGNEREGGAADARLLRLLRTCASDDGRLEMGVRAWAAQDDAAHRIVGQVDEERIAYVAVLLRGTGMLEADTLPSARVVYLAWLGSYTGTVPTDAEQRVADMERLWRITLGR